MATPHARAQLRPMHRSRQPRGTTLLELLFALSLIAVLLGFAYPRMSRTIERYAVRAAADAFTAQVARARIAAITYGGADLVIDPVRLRAQLRGPDNEMLGEQDLGTFAVAITVDGQHRQEVDLSFDALGIGRMANRTFRFQRGGAEARVTLSAYGRAREW
jgi:prepilin-type N-terminal cleavage/methylation domain-containing protein